ncbi:MAG TPA: hypothetical protein VNU44_14570 [Bryobacteraceae bacterium]|jgi:hypothetical protein|nr:hypothetical protein [Bryobacteraceae bacterium]
MEWDAGKTPGGMPQAIFRDGDKVIAKVYMSPDNAVLRFVLLELEDAGQLKIDAAHKILDFRRKK